MASTEPLPLNLDFWYQVVNFFFSKVWETQKRKPGDLVVSRAVAVIHQVLLREHSLAIYLGAGIYIVMRHY